jgi:hypothetical protein
MSDTARGNSKANAIKLDQQAKMARGELMGHIDPMWARGRYIDDAAIIDVLAAEMKCSVIQTRRYLQAHGIFRDRGFLCREGIRPQARKGIRVPGSIRDRNEKKMRRGSSELRALQAANKRGKFREQSNRWKGGHVTGGYEQSGGGKQRKYEHRRVAEALLKRKLLTKEQVHHVDLDRKNNGPINLLVLSSKHHTLLHVAMRKDQCLDQRAWLLAANFPFEDLVRYA